MPKLNWGGMTYLEQVGYLGRIMHVVASKMEMGYGANSEGEVMGATAGILSSVPDSSISRFYEDRQDLLQKQMNQAIGNIKEQGRISLEDGGEILSVYPDMPDIEKFVKVALDVQSQRLRDSYRHLYDVKNDGKGTGSEDATSPYSGSARFHR